MRFAVVMGLFFVSLLAFGQEQPPTFPPGSPEPRPPVTFPDLPTAEAKYKALEKKLQACEDSKNLFNASYCPANTTPVYCHAGGNRMSYVGDMKCNVSLLANCFGNQIGKVFCGHCAPPPVYQPPVYTYPQTHGTVVYGGGGHRPIFNGRLRSGCGIFGRRCR